MVNIFNLVFFSFALYIKETGEGGIGLFPNFGGKGTTFFLNVQIFRLFS